MRKPRVKIIHLLAINSETSIFVDQNGEADSQYVVYVVVLPCTQSV